MVSSPDIRRRRARLRDNIRTQVALEMIEFFSSKELAIEFLVECLDEGMDAAQALMMAKIRLKKGKT